MCEHVARYACAHDSRVTTSSFIRLHLPRLDRHEVTVGPDHRGSIDALQRRHAGDRERAARHQAQSHANGFIDQSRLNFRLRTISPFQSTRPHSGRIAPARNRISPPIWEGWVLRSEVRKCLRSCANLQLRTFHRAKKRKDLVLKKTG